MLQELFTLVLMFSELSSSFFPIFWVIAYVWLPLLAYDRLTRVWRVDLSRVLSANHLHLHCRQVHTLIISLITQFYCISSILQTVAWLGSELNCGFWEVVWGSTYYLFYYQTLGSYFYIAIILPCYARRRGLGLRDIHDRCEIVNNGLLKVATKTHIWVDWGTWRTQCCLFV